MSEIIAKLLQSEDPIEREAATALLAYQDAKAASGRKRSLGYEPRDIDKLGVKEVISRRVMSQAIGFKGIEKSLSYEAIVARYPEEFNALVVSLAKSRLSSANEDSEILQVYVMNFGEGNHFWNEAKRKGLILLYEDPADWEQLQQGEEPLVRDRHFQNFRKRYNKDTTEAWVTRWINYSKIIRDNLPYIFIHNENGVLWWAEADGSWLDLGVRETPSMVDDETIEYARFIAKRSINGWSNKTKKGLFLKLSELHPIMESISHTQATMQPIKSLRSEYVRALIDGKELSPWEDLDEWRAIKIKGIKNKKNKSPLLSMDELITSPTDYSATQSNQARGFVYIMGLDAYPGIYKVGEANDVEGRKRTLQTGVPEELKIYYEIEFKNSYWAEREIHKLIEHNKVRGEWYKQDLDIIKYYIDNLKISEG